MGIHVCRQIGMYMSVGTCVSMYMYMYMYMYMCMCICMCICIYIYTCMCICIYLHIFMCIYTCICIDAYVHMYIYIHTETHRLVRGDRWQNRCRQGLAAWVREKRCTSNGQHCCDDVEGDMLNMVHLLNCLGGKISTLRPKGMKLQVSSVQAPWTERPSPVLLQARSGGAAFVQLSLFLVSSIRSGTPGRMPRWLPQGITHYPGPVQGITEPYLRLPTEP